MSKVTNNNEFFAGIDLAELRRLAEAASKWPEMGLAATRRRAATVRAFNHAANPATVLSLLDRLAKLERLEEKVCRYCAGCDARASLDEGTP